MWAGLLGGSTWLGFAFYALYAVGKDYNFATETCEAFGYIWIAIKEMSIMVDFAKPAAKPADGSATTTKDASTADSLSKAADAALAAAGIGAKTDASTPAAGDTTKPAAGGTPAATPAAGGTPAATPASGGTAAKTL